MSPSCLQAEPLAQRRHARVLHQDLDLFALLVLSLLYFSTGPDGITGFSTSPAPLRISASLALSALYCGCGGLKLSSAAAASLRLGDAGQHVGRVGLGQIVDDVAGDAAVVHAAAHGVAGEGQHRVGELDLGLGQRVGLHAGLDLRHRIVARIEAVGVDAGEIGRGRPCRARSSRRRRSRAARNRGRRRTLRRSARSFLPPRMRSNLPAASCSRSLSTMAVSAAAAVVNAGASLSPAGTEAVVSARGLACSAGAAVCRRAQQAGAAAAAGGRPPALAVAAASVARPGCGWFGRPAGAMSLRLGGGRSALSGIGTAAMISSSSRRKRCRRKALAPGPSRWPFPPGAVRTVRFASDILRKSPGRGPGSWLLRQCLL